jgi:hypothetical protein
MQERWERRVRLNARDWHVLTDGDPGVTQQRVVTEYGYETEAGQRRDERVGEGVKRGCGGGVSLSLEGGDDMLYMARRAWTTRAGFKNC